ncbi:MULTISPECIES: 3D domain-containing protein [Propionispora]|uniref:3D (Asp-Asp-Asp) domain-containing protein n=2 Tax=Propionispora TaxID=112902 RepID=A0A1H8NKT4_9FIRM|nr:MULTISPECIES: 3D domain-containing protein [Propionispora]SEO30187.1 3D (Asp-Asp-Asp) domain-containing protein [Propionispora vibrioides]SHI40037.1 3D (Asp-Asp-Asp) domain-containing protein [Propionispora hippei DSM 15287]
MLNFKKILLWGTILTVLQMTFVAPVTFAKAAAKPDSYTKKLDIKATAYAPGPHDNGKWGNLTHLGTQIRPGVIAVDPSVIPLGSKVYIEFPDGQGKYAVAEDTGGAIKGNRVDIAVESVAKAYDFGIQHVKVYVLEK